MAKIPSMRRIKNIHFIGIGGSGMSGIAEVLLNLGYRVSGSDTSTSIITERLAMLGAKIFKVHSPENITHADVVITSSAINHGNGELMAAVDKHLPIIPRAQMLAELMRFHYGITIAGTHGKTTTTSIMATILSEADLDPTFVVGGILNSTRSNARLGQGQYFVIEADESDASFLHFNPMAAIVTNIDMDHMATYNNDGNQLKKTFIDFLHRLPFYGLAVLCIDDPLVREILPQISRPIVTYGFSDDADVSIKNFAQHGLGCRMSVDLKRDGQWLDIQLNLPGKHNALNAIAAAIVAHECCHIDGTTIITALKKFSGVGRRIQCHGTITITQEKHNITLIDDYGHHPREITVTIEALRAAFPTRRLVVAFQPHRFTRTQALFKDFVTALSLADKLLLMEIYAANEQPLEGVNGMALVDEIHFLGKTDAQYVKDNEQLLNKLPLILKAGDILLIQGAGSIGCIATQLRKKYGQITTNNHTAHQ